MGSRENQRGQVFFLVCADEFFVAQKISKFFVEEMDLRRKEWEVLNFQLKAVIDTLCRLNDRDVAFARKLATLQPRAYDKFTYSEPASHGVEFPIGSSFQRGATTPSAGGGAAAAGPAVPPAFNWCGAAQLLRWRLPECRKHSSRH